MLAYLYHNGRWFRLDGETSIRRTIENATGLMIREMHTQKPKGKKYYYTYIVVNDHQIDVYGDNKRIVK